MAITFTQLLDLKLNRITNLGAPAVSTDAVTKQYVDNIATGLIWKDAVRVAADDNIDLSSPGVIDGVTLANGDRVLVMGQTDATKNGLYAFDGTALVRASDADQNSELRSGTAVTVTEGGDNGNKTFVLTTDGAITVGTTALNWSLLNSGTSPVYTEGDGIDVTNNQISAVAAPSGGVAVGAAGIAVVADPAGGLTVGGNGLAAKSANGAIGVDTNGVRFVARTNAGLNVDANGAGVAIKTNAGLAVDGTGLAAVVAPDKGLTVDAAGLAVVTGHGVTADSSGVKAVAAPNGGLAVGAAGISVNVKPNTGLTADGTGLGITIRPNDGLDVDGTGLGLTTDPAGGLVTSASGLGIKPSSGAGITVDANGISATLDPNGGIDVDNAGLKVVLDPDVVNDPTEGPLVVGPDGIAINTAFFPQKFAQTVGDGSATSIAVSHGLGTRDVQVEVYSTAAPYDTVYTEVQRTDADTVTLVFGQAPTSGQYRCVVTG